MSFSERNEEEFIVGFFKDKKNGFLVDVGANNGMKGSNCWALIMAGWSGLLIEADPETFKELKKNCDSNPNLRALNSAISDRNGGVVFYKEPTPCSGLSTIQKRLSNPSWKEVYVPSLTLDSVLIGIESVDFLNLDVEGSEMDALSMFSFNIKPTLIMVEYCMIGNGLSEISKLLISNGYRQAFLNEANVAFSLI